MFDEKARAEYEENLVLLAKDIRQDLKSPTLPIVIGELGNGGAKAGSNMIAIRKAQAAAAVRIMPKGSAVFVETHKFARAKEDSPNVGHGHHWFGNAESYFLIGDALGTRGQRPLSAHRIWGASYSPSHTSSSVQSFLSGPAERTSIRVSEMG
jgi:hypothetical protein